MKLHRNARTCPHSRRLIVERVEEKGWTLAQAAEAAGASVRTVSKYRRRYRLEGEEGLLDRPSAPQTVANRTPEERVQVIAALRRLRMTGAEIAELLAMPYSTVSAILSRIGLGRMSALEPREPANRYEKARPGELVHIDVKKLGKIGRPGKRVNGDPRTRSRGIGWEFVHVAVDDATRLAYEEVLADEKAATAVGFLRRALAFFASYGVSVERLLTDNGPAYRSVLHALACKALGLKHSRTRPYRPQTNGKAERFIRTLLGGWAYGRSTGAPRSALEVLAAGSSSTIGADHTAPSAAKRPSCAYRRLGTTWLGLTSAVVLPRQPLRSYALPVLTCPSCGRENPEDFRFCGACGAELATTSAREVRKTVTVLFADVTGSTALGERLDPESFRRVMARYFDAARSCLERHGGTVEKFIGDAVMAVFGVPTVHEDDALRAVRAADELRDSLLSLNDELERDYGVSLQLRTGVNTGEVVAGTEERLATGDAVNVAARLEQAAQPGEILIGEQTLRLARGAIEVEPVEPLTLKGKAESLSAHRLLRVVEGAPAFERRFDAPLVGRREELARVRAAFDDAVSERRCRLVTVLGPPGIGKSRLARELAAVLTDDADVLSGRCLPYGEGITYWPLVEIFREAHAEDELAAALSAGVPEEIFWSVRKALERRARERPLGLVLEDIHWAEPTFLDLIEHLADWTRDAPLLLVCLARSELLDERPAWGGQSIALAPLSEAESDRLIEELLGGSQVEDAARARIREVAEGNPLFVEQLMAMLAEGGEPEQVPPSIQALLAARLDALPDEERDLLERASAIGFEFEWEALGELAPDRRRPSGTQLAALVRKELIRPHEAIEDTFRFRHLLIRDAAYERVPKERRSELHERYADWLEGRGAEFEEIIAYHLEQAYRCLTELGPPGARAQALAERAAELLSASGRRAFARGDAHAAVNMLERAGALLPADDRRRLRLLPFLGRALIESGDMKRADSVLSEAAERARAAGERVVATDAVMSLTVLRLHTAPQESAGQEVVWRELEAALPLYTQLGDEAGLARAFGLAGKLRFWRGEAAAAIEDLERAARHARNAGEWAQEAESLQFVVTAMLMGPMPVDAALAGAEALSSGAEPNRLLEVHVLRVRGHLEAMRGRFGTARDLIARAKALAEELGLELTLARIALQAGPLELLAGDAAAAERELRPAYEALERMQDWGHLSSIAPRLAEAVALQGRDEEALALTERVESMTVPEDVDAQVSWRRVRAKVLARRGEVEEAERLAREATSLAARTDYIDLHAHALADLAEVLRLVGRPEESPSALEEAIRLYEEKGNVAAAGNLRGLLAEPPLEV
jgi:class 3 adenylate cyclase/transposase InsO family protein/tetratricopeptide (TPR) repeat protein